MVLNRSLLRDFSGYWNQINGSKIHNQRVANGFWFANKNTRYVKTLWWKLLKQIQCVILAILSCENFNFAKAAFVIIFYSDRNLDFLLILFVCFSQRTCLPKAWRRILESQRLVVTQCAGTIFIFARPCVDWVLTFLCIHCSSTRPFVLRHTNAYERWSEGGEFAKRYATKTTSSETSPRKVKWFVDLFWERGWDIGKY